MTNNEWLCEYCDTPNVASDEQCANCGMFRVEERNVGQSGGKRTPKRKAAYPAPAHTPTPVLARVFDVLAGLEMFGGIVLAFQLKETAYVAAILCVVAGFIFGFLFLAISQVLMYLNEIREGLRRI